MPNTPAGQLASQLEKRDEEWRQDVRKGLSTLAQGQAELDKRYHELSTHFSALQAENATQHSDLSGRLNVVVERFEKALEDANKKLEARTKLGRVLVCIIIFLMGTVLGTQAKLIGILKDIMR